MFEVWKAINGRKSYLVAISGKVRASELYDSARKYFKASADNINVHLAWVYNDELYLENPHKSKAKIRLVAYLKRKGE